MTYLDRDTVELAVAVTAFTFTFFTVIAVACAAVVKLLAMADDESRDE